MLGIGAESTMQRSGQLRKFLTSKHNIELAEWKRAVADRRGTRTARSCPSVGPLSSPALGTRVRLPGAAERPVVGQIGLVPGVAETLVGVHEHLDQQAGHQDEVRQPEVAVHVGPEAPVRAADAVEVDRQAGCERSRQAGHQQACRDLDELQAQRRGRPVGQVAGEGHHGSDDDPL